MKRKPKMRKFWVELGMELEISEDVIKQGLSDEFASYIGRMTDPTEVAEHIAHNVGVNQINLTQIDGYADRRDDEIKVTERLGVVYVSELDT